MAKYIKQKQISYDEYCEKYKSKKVKRIKEKDLIQIKMMGLKINKKEI